MAEFQPAPPAVAPVKQRRGPGRPFPKGVSGNPGGRRKKTDEERRIEFELQQACRGKAQAIFDSLLKIALHSKNEHACIAAGAFLIERGYGKAVERREQRYGVLDDEPTALLLEMRDAILQKKEALRQKLEKERAPTDVGHD